MADRDVSLKILSDNRQARHNYFLMERFEAGLVLTGTEVKAAKDGKVQLKDAYGAVLGNEAWLVNAHISQYSHGNRENHTPERRRKLLLRLPRQMPPEPWRPSPSLRRREPTRH